MFGKHVQKLSEFYKIKQVGIFLTVISILASTSSSLEHVSEWREKRLQIEGERMILLNVVRNGCIPKHKDG